MSNSPSPLRPDALLVRSPDQVFGEIDGKVVLMSIENGEYYNLNAVGSRVWELLATPRSLKELVARLETEFEVDHATCEAEVGEFARTLAQAGLIRAED